MSGRTLALNLLCENPSHLTGLSSMFKEFVHRSLRLDPDLRWVVFLGPQHEFGPDNERIEFCRIFCGNDHLLRRLYADHFLVSATAKQRGAQILLTVGFVPIRQLIPTVMHLFTLHHLNRSNRTGVWRSAYRRWAAAKGIELANLIITNSRTAANRIIAEVPSAATKLIQSYEGVDHATYHAKAGPDERNELRKNLGVPPDYILWLSNLYPYKQPDRLIRAYAALPQSLQAKYPIVFAGGDWAEQQNSLQSLARDVGVTGELLFLGWIQDRWIAPLLRQARILVSPSREETFGRSIAEAMACGTPCVVHDIQIMHEVTDGAAWIVDFENGNEAAQSIAEALTDEQRRAEVIRRGLLRSRDFDFETLTRERLRAIYDSVNLGGCLKSMGSRLPKG
jgi:glycosyltransferase involved in cell wall biosynthesis